MESVLRLEILPQPDDSTCGPTCLHAVYRYYGEQVGLEQVIAATRRLENGGTLGVLLGSQALARGYRVTIYTYNLTVFDPTWFTRADVDLVERLESQIAIKSDDERLVFASRAYIDFLRQGGQLRFEDLTSSLIRRFLKRGAPILTGLSATYLYRTPRERGEEVSIFDDLRGTPMGHFVVLCGYHVGDRNVLVADPWPANPVSGSHQYWVGMDRLVNSILLGIITYDANLVIIEPYGRGVEHAGADRRQ
ncbi:MAG: hypothetical protein OZ921_13290 [Sorangiineae bacterium]|nr:hypothetical protein [Polyangiaceae bacterium]MEB2323479.1 hypothetical protein [Sorangiineae bacterium]